MLAEPPFVVQMCFPTQVNIKDKDKGGDFDFSWTLPDRTGLGSRIVFQPDAYGVAVYPGSTTAQTRGEWTFHWRVTDPQTLEPSEGDVHFSVSPSGNPIPRVTPPSCLASGQPATVSPSPTASPGPTVAGQSPAPSRSATASPAGSPTASPAATTVKDEGDSDVLELALLTIGAAGGAVLLALLGYVFRKRIGFWLHRPPPGGGDAGRH